MSTVAERVRTRLDPSLTTAGLFVGDLVAIATFVIVGEISHSIDPLANPAIVADTYVPFLVGWLVFALPTGVYGLTARTDIRQGVLSTVAAWTGGVVVAQALRSTALFHGDFAVTFAVVSLVVGGTFLLGWRALAVFFTTRGRLDRE